MAATAKSRSTRAGSGMTIDQLEAEMRRRLAEEHGAGRDQLAALRRTFRLLRDDLGVKTAGQVGDDLFDRFERIRPELAPATRANMAARLKRTLRLAADWGLIPRMPRAPRIPSPRHLAPTRRVRQATADEVTTLSTHLEGGSGESWMGARLWALVALILLAGLRLGQALDLRIADVDLAAGMIRTRRPSGVMGRLAEDLVPISPRLREILSGWIARLGGGEWLFPSTTGRARWKRTNSNRRQETPLTQLQAAARAAGVADGMTFEAMERYVRRNMVRGIMLEMPATGSRPELASSAGPPLPRIRITRPYEPFYVDGVPGFPLSPCDFDVLKALLESGPDGHLTGAELRKIRGGYSRSRSRFGQDPLLGPLIVAGPWGGTGLRAIWERAA